MEAQALRAEIERFDPGIPIEKAWTPPAAWYTSRDVAELERRAVFARTWQAVARVAEVAEPGAYVSGCLAGEPWLVVRGTDGELRAFHNTCRHKGREVVQGRGKADSLVCGYHAWTYDLRGRLTSAPRTAGIEDFERAEMSLPPLQIECWGPWVFVNADPRAAPLRSLVPELDARLAATRWDELVYAGSRSWTIDCNWKVVVDNYLDGGYHIPHMHPTLDAQIDMRTYRTEVFGEFSIQSSASAKAPDGRLDFDSDARMGSGALYAWIHPNFMLNRYGPCLDSNHVIPLGPGRCRVEYEFFFAPEAGAGGARFVEASMEQSDVTQREDVAICESVQVGLGSSSYDRGRYAPRVETGEHHFHGLLARDLRCELDRG